MKRMGLWVSHIFNDLTLYALLTGNSASRYQFNDNFSTQTAGGVLVYYVSAQPGKITAFKPVRIPPRLAAAASPGRERERERVN